MVIIMKDFSMKKRPDYIKNCYREEDGSLTVVFADGTIYDDYLDNYNQILNLKIFHFYYFYRIKYL